MGRPRKISWDCVKYDTESLGLSCEDAQDKECLTVDSNNQLPGPDLPRKRPLSVNACACLYDRGKICYV